MGNQADPDGGDQPAEADSPQVDRAADDADARARDAALSQDAALIDALTAQRRACAAGEARQAALMLEYVETARARATAHAEAARPGNGEVAGQMDASVAADELALAMTVPTGTIQRWLAMYRRVRGRLPQIWALWADGAIDQYKTTLIDQAACRLVLGDSLLRLDAEAARVAPGKTAAQLRAWLARFVARTEPTRARARHRRAFAGRTVYLNPDADAMGWLNLHHSGLDLARIDARLTTMARQLGADDPRTMDQRKADLAVDLLLGRHVPDGPGGDRRTGSATGTEEAFAGTGTEEAFAGTGTGTEEADPDETTTVPEASRRQTSGAATSDTAHARSGCASAPVIGIVVPLQTLTGKADQAAETLDRTQVVPADRARQLAAEPGTLFYRLLTDNGGNLLEVNELGRFPSHKLGFAIHARDGTSRFPTSSIPASHCDLDHTIAYHPKPDTISHGTHRGDEGAHTGGPTTAANLGPLDRRSHNAKTRGHLRLRQPDPGTFTWQTRTGHIYTSAAEPLPVASWPTPTCPADAPPPTPPDTARPTPLPPDPEPHWRDILTAQARRDAHADPHATAHADPHASQPNGPAME